MVAGAVPAPAPAPAPQPKPLPEAVPELGVEDTNADPQGQTDATAVMIAAGLRGIGPVPAPPSNPNPGPVAGREFPGAAAALPAQLATALASLLSGPASAEAPAQTPTEAPAQTPTEAPAQTPAAQTPAAQTPAAQTPPVPNPTAPVPAADSDAVPAAPAALPAHPATPATPSAPSSGSATAVGSAPTDEGAGGRADPTGLADQSTTVGRSTAPASSRRRPDKNDGHAAEPLSGVPAAPTPESRRSAEEMPIKTEVRSTEVRSNSKVDSVGPTAPTPPLVSARAEVTEIADAPATTPVVPPAVHEQIVSAVVPLHGRGDGRHEVTLELRPEELGVIRVEVIVENQTVHLTLHAAEPATGRLLSAALHELRSTLTEAGLTAGQVGVGPDSGAGAGQRRPSATGDSPDRRGSRAGRAGTPSAAGSDPVRTIRPAAAGRLDLLL
jgi:flagellar hook-length control protein FliK